MGLLQDKFAKYDLPQQFMAKAYILISAQLTAIRIQR